MRCFEGAIQGGNAALKKNGLLDKFKARKEVLRSESNQFLSGVSDAWTVGKTGRNPASLVVLGGPPSQVGRY